MEIEILREARTVTGRATLRQKDILAWNTGAIKGVAEDEIVLLLPQLCVNILVKRALVRAR